MIEQLHSLKPTRDKGLGILLLVSVMGLVADSITLYFLPPGSEVNPLVSILGVDGSIAMKTILIGYLIFLWNYLPASIILTVVYAIAIAAGFLGFGSNVSVLL